LKDVCTCRLLC